MVKNKKMFIMDELLMDNKILCVTHGKNIWGFSSIA
jgi:hypothetical protein